MKKIISVVLMAITTNVFAAPYTIHFAKGEWIGHVDGYDKNYPDRIIGQNIWTNTMSFQKGEIKKEIPIAYIIDDMNNWRLAWIGNASTGKEDKKNLQWLKEHGYDTKSLLADIKSNIAIKQKQSLN